MFYISIVLISPEQGQFVSESGALNQQQVNCVDVFIPLS